MDMQIFLITGTPGAGKTSVSEVLCRRLSPSAHLQVDFFRKLIKGGYASPRNWNTEVERQYTLARKNAAQTAKNIAKAGFTVVVDDIVRQKWVREWRQYFKDFNLRLILLNPKLNMAKKRNLKRRVWTVGEGIVENLHDLLKKENRQENGWQIIDNTHLSIEETVDMIIGK